MKTKLKTLLLKIYSKILYFFIISIFFIKNGESIFAAISNENNDNVMFKGGMGPMHNNIEDNFIEEKAVGIFGILLLVSGGVFFRGLYLYKQKDEKLKKIGKKYIKIGGIATVIIAIIGLFIFFG